MKLDRFARVKFPRVETEMFLGAKRPQQISFKKTHFASSVVSVFLFVWISRDCCYCFPFVTGTTSNLSLILLWQKVKAHLVGEEITFSKNKSSCSRYLSISFSRFQHLSFFCFLSLFLPIYRSIFIFLNTNSFSLTRRILLEIEVSEYLNECCLTLQGHAHAPNIKEWVEEVDETYKNFSTRMDHYRQKVNCQVERNVVLVMTSRL